MVINFRASYFDIFYYHESLWCEGYENFNYFGGVENFADMLRVGGCESLYAIWKFSLVP